MFPTLHYTQSGQIRLRESELVLLSPCGTKCVGFPCQQPVVPLDVLKFNSSLKLPGFSPYPRGYRISPSRLPHFRCLSQVLPRVPFSVEFGCKVGFLQPHPFRFDNWVDRLTAARKVFTSLATMEAQILKKLACNAGDAGSIPGSGKNPWRREWLHTPVFLLGEFHEQRSLVGYNPRCYRVGHD